MEQRVINDVDVKQLEHRMRHADWTHDYSSDLAIRNNGYTEVQYLKALLESISKNKDGKDVATKLWDKYVPEGTYTKPQFLGGQPGEAQVIRKLEGRQITDDELKNIQQQFSIGGFKDAYSQKFVEQLKRCALEYRVPLNIDNQGDSVSATLYVKRAAQSLNYFFNKASISVLIDGGKNEVTQMFYFTDKNKQQVKDQDDVRYKQANKFTLKKAANYLAGRPVYNWFLDKEGKLYDAWAKINFKKVMNNGDYEMKRYTSAYPFDLKKMLQNYCIKDLATPAYATRLYDSLERGNLQKVTFVDKQGREEQLYITPQIGLVAGGSLNVYAPDRTTRIPVETLAANEYIGKELAHSITERMKIFQSEKQEVVLQQEMPAKHKNVQRHTQ